jgi:hypothetical protein
MRRIYSLALLSISGAVSLFAGVDSGLLGWVPADSAAFVGFDFEHARNSPLSQYLLTKTPPSDFKVDDMIKEVGFDPRKDLQYALMAINVDQVMKANGGGASPSKGTGNTATTAMPGGFNSEGLVIVFKGKFDLERINKSLAKEKDMPEKYLGHDLSVFKDNDGETIAMTFSDEGILAMGRIKTLKKLLDQRAAGSTLNGEMLKNVQSAADGQDLWIYSKVLGNTLPMGWGISTGTTSPIPQLKALASLTELDLGVKMGATIELRINATSSVEQDAITLADGLRFLASAVQMQRQSSPAMQSMAQVFDG